MESSSSDYSGREQQLFVADKTIAIVLGGETDRASSYWGFERSANHFVGYLHAAKGLRLPPEAVLNLFSSPESAASQLERIADFLQHRNQEITDLLVYCGGHASYYPYRRLSLAIGEPRKIPGHVYELPLSDLISVLNENAPARCVLLLDIARSTTPDGEGEIGDLVRSNIADTLVISWANTSYLRDQPTPCDQLIQALSEGVGRGPPWLSFNNIFSQIQFRSHETSERRSSLRPETYQTGKTDLLNVPAFPNTRFPSETFADAGRPLDEVVESLIANNLQSEIAAWQRNPVFMQAWPQRNTSRQLSAGTRLGGSMRSDATVGGRMLETALGRVFFSRFNNRAENMACYLAVQVLAELSARAQLPASERELVVAVRGDDPRLSLVRLTSSDTVTPSGKVLDTSRLASRDALHSAVLDLSSSPLDQLARPALKAFLDVEQDMTLDRAELAALLLWMARPALVMFPTPRMVPLCVPCPNINVDGPHGLPSTAGAVAFNAVGTKGITAAFHATGPQGTMVRIGAHECVVQISSEVYDTVFVPVPDGVNLPELRAPAGLLNRPPWLTEPGWFWGRASGHTSTLITGHDVGLPHARPGRQLCVQTRPNTEEGDSGAGLVIENGKLVGFLFQKTEYGSPIQFSDWIWALSAFRALGLSLASEKEGD